MTVALDGFALLACGLALCAAAARWLRVAQREHYLAGAVSSFSRRWWLGDRLHRVLVVMAVAGFAVSLFVPPVALVVAATVAAGPLGLSVRGRSSKLALTRRLRSLAATVALIAIGLTAIGAIGGLGSCVVFAAGVDIAAPVIVELALVLRAPFEQRRALGFVDRAREVLHRVNPVVVAITGSYGKTSTKLYVAHLLSGRYRVLASPRSYNNQAGLSRTVNELLVQGTDVLVAEMGTYGQGEIAAMCAWLRPKVAVITAIGPMHLERFGSLDATLMAKAEITKDAERVILNVDDDRLSALAMQLSGAGRHVVTCSAGTKDADVVLTPQEGGAVLKVSGSQIGEVRFDELSAPVALSNVACAVAAALELDCEPTEVLARLSSLPRPSNRLEPGSNASGVLVLDDTFNANPLGARLGLRRLASIGSTGSRRVVVTPGLIELGPLQDEENEMLGAQAACIADLLVVGRTNKMALVRGAAREGRAALLVRTRNDAVTWVRDHLRAGDVVLYENDLPDHFP